MYPHICENVFFFYYCQTDLKHGAVRPETGPAVWLLGNQGKAWDGRLWTRLLIPTCGELYAVHSGRPNLNSNVFYPFFLLFSCFVFVWSRRQG